MKASLSHFRSTLVGFFSDPATWVLLALLCVALVEPSYAADPFGEVEDKGNDILDALQGSIGIIIITISVIVGGFGLLFNMIQKTWAFRIIGGGVLIGSAASIASWLIG